MKLTDAFERVIVLSLPFKTERQERLKQQLAESGLADPAKVVWQRALVGDWLPPPAWWGAGNGAWGCLQSHVRVVQDAVMDNLDSYCVLEDDCCFHARSAELFSRLWSELPADWDQVYLGGQHRRLPEAVPDHPFLWRGTRVNRTHCFALRRDVFARFQQHILHAPDYLTGGEGGAAVSNHFHIDHQLERAHARRDWNVYCPAWWIAGQDAGESNISGRANPRMWWHPWMHSPHLPFLLIDPSQPPSEASAVHLHAGHNLKAGTWEDVGVARAHRDDARLREFLGMIADEAMSLWRLPAVSHPHLTVDRLASLWPAGCRDASAMGPRDLRDLADYPFNGLFAHPLNDHPPPISL